MAATPKRLLSLLVVLVALGATGCGDSENTSSSGPIKPALKVPDEKISDATTDETGATDETSDENSSSTQQTPSSGNTGGAAPGAQQDSAENDTPPPANSPADTYEQFCRENPGACGD